MSKRQQLPPQIRKIEVKDRSSGKPVTRYQVTMDAGQDPATGKRRQVRRRVHHGNQGAGASIRDIRGRPGGHFRCAQEHHGRAVL